MIVDKKVVMQLVGLDGNAFSLMGAFKNNARKQGWKKNEIDSVLNECQKGDYNHLLCMLMDHVEEPDDDEEDYDDEDEYDDDEEEDE